MNMFDVYSAKNAGQEVSGIQGFAAHAVEDLFSKANAVRSTPKNQSTHGVDPDCLWNSQNENEIGLPKHNMQKRKGRKNKKRVEKELLSYYFDDSEKNEPLSKDNRYYENMEHLSAKERHKFESAFTVPKNKHQQEYVNSLLNKDKKIVVCTGPAGTGKTLFATEYGIRKFLTGGIEKLIFTRPSVSVDEDLGYLPGTLEDKMAPWIRPIYDILYNFMTPAEVSAIMEEKAIEIAPLGYMRGRTFKNTWIVADEMQNSTVAQMKMLLTRLGENSRLIITGDLEQFDRQDELNGLDDFLSRLKGKRSDSISSFEFDRQDIQREDVVREVLEIYAAYETPASYKDIEDDDNCKWEEVRSEE